MRVEPVGLGGGRREPSRHLVAHAVVPRQQRVDSVAQRGQLRPVHRMAAGVTDRLWEVADMVNVLEAWEASQE